MELESSHEYEPQKSSNIFISDIPTKKTSFASVKNWMDCTRADFSLAFLGAKLYKTLSYS